MVQSEKAKEREQLEIEEVKLSNEYMRVRIEKEKGTFIPKNYKSLKLVGDVLTVILDDGSIISKSEATAEDFKRVKNSRTLDDILAIMVVIAL